MRMGAGAQKALLLLLAGVTLSLTTRPDTFFRVIKNAAREWKRIEQRSLKRALGNLYHSKLVRYKENSDRTITVVLTEGGKKMVENFLLQ